MGRAVTAEADIGIAAGTAGVGAGVAANIVAADAYAYPSVAGVAAYRHGPVGQLQGGSPGRTYENVVV